MQTKKIIIGARGSILSLAQTTIVKDMLTKILPETKIEIKIITTKGDRNMNPVPLDTVGKGWFTKELDRSLLKNDIAIAVHSLKDIPEELPEGLIIAAIPKREDARETLISRNNVFFEKLKKGAIIGTDSTRRKSQILHKRPDLIVKSLRGNVNRRLEKLNNGEYDGIFLAAAGLKRLGLASKISQYFDQTDLIPSPGQGALAIVIKKTNKKLIKIVNALTDADTLTAVSAERAFSKTVGGGCKMPIGAYAKIEKNKITVYGMLGSLDGTMCERGEISGKPKDANMIGKKLAKQLLRKSKSWFSNASELSVVVTRPIDPAETFTTDLARLGIKTYAFASIKIEKNNLSQREKNYIKNIASFDWLLFTSRHGIDYFMETINELHIDEKILLSKQIGAVGPKTAEQIKKYGLHVSFMPSIYTTDNLAKQLKNVKGKKILMARSTIATPLLTKLLREKGAKVTNIPIYKTTYTKNSVKELAELLYGNSILCLTFTSPSTVRGFFENIDKQIARKVLEVPVVSIGPVTTREAKKFGFKHIHTAKIHTTNEMLTVIKENLL